VGIRNVEGRNLCIHINPRLSFFEQKAQKKISHRYILRSKCNEKSRMFIFNLRPLHFVFPALLPTSTALIAKDSNNKEARKKHRDEQKKKKSE
jgi:hypothetical protein